MAPESLDSGAYTSKSDVLVFTVYRALIGGGGGSLDVHLSRFILSSIFVNVSSN